MKSYTANSIEAIAAVTNALPDHYDMSLSFEDMIRLIHVLSDVADNRLTSEGRRDWAMSFLSTIAKTLGIEFV